MKNKIVKVIKIYQSWISPFLPQACRFYPSCSVYASECFQRHSMGRAFFLSIIRLVKCHPFHPGGFDPVKNG